MNVASPDILTLLAWAERRAAGDLCAEWDAWRAASREAAWKSECIHQAQTLLAGGGHPPDDEAELFAEDVAQLVEGSLPAPAQIRIEAACWQSTRQLAEVLSALRFRQEPPAADPTARLESRLEALGPPPKPHDTNGKHTNGKPAKFRLSQMAQHATEKNVEGPPVVAVQPAASPDARSAKQTWHWPLIAAALTIAIVASGALGWIAATWRQSIGNQPPVARGPSELPAAPEPEVDIPPPRPKQPDDKSPTPSIDRVQPRPAPVPADNPTPPTSKETAPRTSDEQKTTPSRPGTLGVPKHRPPVAPQAPDLAFRSAQGLLLVDTGQRGKWQVAPNTLALREPTNLLSLAESWTTAEVPGVGNLVWGGNGEATMTTLPDGTIEIRVLQGRMAVEGLKPGAHIRLLAGDAAWTARGVADGATLAVVHDPTSSGLLVPRGSVAVDDLVLNAGQITRWYDGAPQPPQPIALAGINPSDAVADIAPPLMNPWDLSWLTPPDENSRRVWRNTYGRIADRLAAADDVRSELSKMAADIREPRQAALLARWNIEVSPAESRSSQIWKSLTDRRAMVRVAGVKSLLELSPGDERRQEITRLLSEKLGAATANRVNEWLATAWQAGAPPKPQADEIAAHLQHNELAVRQIAVSMLELHTAAAFRQIGGVPPVYDAGSTSPRRAAGQAEWSRVLQELYNPTRKVPAMRTRQGLLNAAPAAGT